MSKMSGTTGKSNEKAKPAEWNPLRWFYFEFYLLILVLFTNQLLKLPL